MKRLFPILAIALTVVALAACKQEAPAETAAQPQAQSAPTDQTDNDGWKRYLSQVVDQNRQGVTDRVFAYYLPADSRQPSFDDPEHKSPYDRQLDALKAAVMRGVLPGNLLAFGSPDSTAMGDLVVEAFAAGNPNSLQGSIVLFIGRPEDNERVKAAAEAIGASYRFVEVK
jgi:predicted small lipoprotein YifL